MMWSRYKVRKVHQIPIVERMWQAIAQQIAAADPKPLRGFGRLSSGVKHHEGSGDRRSIDSTIRGSWRHRAPSRTDVAGTVHLYGSAVDGGLKPHSDIDLLVTVTVRLDETTRRALINDLLETSASPERARFSAL